MKCSGLNSKFAHNFSDMDKSVFQISGQIVDVVNSRIFKGTIFIENGKIANIIEDDNDNEDDNEDYRSSSKSPLTAKLSL